MNIRTLINVKAIGAALAVSATCLLAQAQTAPSIVVPQSKSAKTPKPAADVDKGVIGSGGGAILSREELRACLKQEADVRTRIEAHDKQRAELDADKQQIVTDQQALRTEREPIDAAKRDIEGLAAEMKTYGGRVEAFNKRAADFSDSGTRAAQRERDEINAERETLEKQRLELDARKTSVNGQSTEAVRTYNVKATALDATVNNWNQRNEAWNQQGTELERARTTWLKACSDRRYREDDETAIKRGQ